MAKKILSLILITVLCVTSITVSAASGSRNDMYSAFNKKTFDFQKYSFYDKQNISLQLLEIIDEEKALEMLSENSFNKSPEDDEQLLIFKFYIKYNKGPEKALSTSNIISRYSNDWYSKAGREITNIRTVYIDSTKYPNSADIYPGASAVVYINMIIKKSVGYPVLKTYNKTKEVWLDTNPNFKESSTSKVRVKSVVMNASSVTLNRGKSIDLEAVITPNNATNKSVSWKSNKPSVAVVDSKGRVTGKAKGTATIYATTSDGKKVTKATIFVK